MRIAIVSDIHGNLEALRKVLADIDRSNVERIISLGDNVGYGPEPERVLNLLRERNILSLMGNHEQGLIDSSHAPLFNPLAWQSLNITRKLLSQGSLDYIRDMRVKLAEDQSLFVHGSPPDSLTRYFIAASLDEKRQIFHDMEEKMCFVGHSHALALVSFDGKKVEHDLFPEGIIHLPRGRKYIVNAGSVGQPRDGDSRAKYVVWDSRKRRLEVHMVPYDVGKTVRKILELGFPPHNAERLSGHVH
ncbi:MAG TPA: metallophosphoesterase family protein [Syntrophobacteraceae bacterium]|nr:metallophosphoesterase family protein [Syntrophobacteraceae bacterium]